MIQKTQAEKDAIKAAKKAYKNGDRTYHIDAPKPEREATKPIILSGIMEDENPLPSDYPVYWDYLYVIDHGGGKVIRSDIKGTVADLRRYLLKRGFDARVIRNCKMVSRNIY